MAKNEETFAQLAFKPISSLQNAISNILNMPKYYIHTRAEIYLKEIWWWRKNLQDFFFYKCFFFSLVRISKNFNLKNQNQNYILIFIIQKGYIWSLAELEKIICPKTTFLFFVLFKCFTLMYDELRGENQRFLQKFSSILQVLLSFSC